MLNFLIDLLHQTFLTFLVGGCVIGVIAGAGMLINPDGVLRLNQYFNKWFSTEKATDILDRQHRIERVLYRHHRLTGVLVMVGSVYTLYILNFSFNPKLTAALLDDGKNNYLVEWILESAVLAFNLGCAAALVVGAILLVRPSLLKSFEALLNHWVNTEKSLQTIDTMRYRLDHFIASHIRIAGILVILGSIYVINALRNFI